MSAVGSNWLRLGGTLLLLRVGFSGNLTFSSSTAAAGFISISSGLTAALESSLLENLSVDTVLCSIQSNFARSKSSSQGSTEKPSFLYQDSNVAEEMVASVT
jgi:hypothetical protein